MGRGFIELDLERIEEKQIDFIKPQLVDKSSTVASQYVSSSLFQQMRSFPTHNIAGLAKKVESEMNAAKGSILNISNFVQECRDNYLSLDNFLTTGSSTVTTSSSANSIIAGIHIGEYNHLDFEIPNSKIKLEYQLKFHPIVREETLMFQSFQGADSKTKEEINTKKETTIEEDDEEETL